ncbi:MAG: GntR family transcriptional regulator [Lachnospiraceae bacterium]|nr:GntR family transcriptional regulator [Lachnospiraceae bacterium]
MHVMINHSSMVPIYEQVMEEIKDGILKGTLQEGEALPSVRGMAKELRISALTVKKAYDKLEEEGFVTTIHGKGTFVNASDKSLAMEARRKDVEEEFARAIEKALLAGLTADEIKEIIEIMLEDLV